MTYRQRIFGALAALLLTAGSLPAQTASHPSAKWEFDVVPYLWTAGLNGDVGLGGVIAPVDMGFSDIWDNLNGALFIGLNGKKDKAGFLIDFMYLDLRPTLDTPGPLYSRADIQIEQVTLDLKGTYRANEWDGGAFELTAGTRYMSMDQTLRLVPRTGSVLPTQSLSGGDDWWDFVIGYQLKHQLSDKWHFTSVGDIGAGGSSLTWDILGSFDYQISRGWQLRAGYRYLSYDYKDDGFVYDVDTSGFIFGAGYHW